jgi:ABC-type uncharacterized transport system auxiliary subunit
MRARTPVVLANLIASSLLSACVSVKVGNETGLQSQYQLVDIRASPSTPSAPAPAPASTRPAGRELLISPLPGNSLDDSFALAYSSAPQQRAAYQFASWSDRPSTQLAQLLVDRLATHSGFSSVALSGRGVGGDLQLNLVVNDFYHDASDSPGIARVDVAAELVDRNRRKLIARGRFTATSPLEQSNAPAASLALSRATSDVLDQLVRWVQANAAPTAAAAR